MNAGGRLYGGLKNRFQTLKVLGSVNIYFKNVLSSSIFIFHSFSLDLKYSTLGRIPQLGPLPDGAYSLCLNKNTFKEHKSHNANLTYLFTIHWNTVIFRCTSDTVKPQSNVLYIIFMWVLSFFLMNLKYF